MHIPVIEHIEVTPFQIPFATFLRSGRQMHVKQAENVLVRVTADDGTVGIAEANAFAELFGESQASIVHAISDWIAPRVKGITLCDFERLWHQLDIMRNNNSAKAAVDMAVHDALARVLGLPMYRMLGGYRDRVPLTWIIAAQARRAPQRAAARRRVRRHAAVRARAAAGDTHDSSRDRSARIESARAQSDDDKDEHAGAHKDVTRRIEPAGEAGRADAGKGCKRRRRCSKQCHRDHRFTT